MCRSRRELSNEYLLAKIGVDTPENEPLEVWEKIRFNIHSPPQKVVVGAQQQFNPDLTDRPQNPTETGSRNQTKAQLYAVVLLVGPKLNGRGSLRRKPADEVSFLSKGKTRNDQIMYDIVQENTFFSDQGAL